MNESVVREKVRTMILENFLNGGAASALRDDASLERSHIVDSVKTLELIVFIEENFGFTVENDDALPENFDTVDAIVAYIQRKMGAL
jgi:acyl carrier protein